MSFKTWKEEFYPIDAKQCEPGIQAITHSLQKWIGLRRENLKRHNMVYAIEDWYGKDYQGIRGRHSHRDHTDLPVSDESCALCRHYEVDDQGNSCKPCPIVKVHGKRCDDADDSPYRIFRDTGNPEPMIEMLEATLSFYRSGAETTSSK